MKRKRLRKWVYPNWLQPLSWFFRSSLIRTLGGVTEECAQHLWSVKTGGQRGPYAAPHSERLVLRHRSRERGLGGRQAHIRPIPSICPLLVSQGTPWNSVFSSLPP